MAKPTTRRKLMERLGATQKNNVWAWCGVNDEERKVFLSLWSETRDVRGDEGRASYIVQEPSWGKSDSGEGEEEEVIPARADQDEKLAMVFDEGYQAFGYVVESNDPEAEPRAISTTKTSFIFELELEKLDDGTVLGYPLGRIEIR